MANIRLATVIRKDLALTPGMLAAQASHVGDQWLRTATIEGREFTEIEKDWMKEPYIAVLAVNNGEELEIIENAAKNRGLPVHSWSDLLNSRILKGAYRAKVGISIGPEDADKLKEITGNLPLFE
jgi:peptidyl-tRNA hydrolase